MIDCTRRKEKMSTEERTRGPFNSDVLSHYYSAPSYRDVWQKIYVENVRAYTGFYVAMLSLATVLFITSSEPEVLSTVELSLIYLFDHFGRVLRNRSLSLVNHSIIYNDMIYNDSTACLIYLARTEVIPIIFRSCL